MPIKIGRGRRRNIKYQGLFLFIDSINDSLVFMEILLIWLLLGHIKIWDHYLMGVSVYVLTNPAMPNMVKIGKKTRNLELRLADLSSTGVPLPY